MPLRICCCSLSAELFQLLHRPYAASDDDDDDDNNNNNKNYVMAK